MCFDGGLSAALTVGGAALQGMGAMQQGRTAARAARVQSYIAQQNVETAQLRGTFEAARVASQLDDVLAGQTASVSARGLDPGFGSPLLAQGMSAAQAETDMALVRARAAQDVAGSLWQAYGAESKADDALRAGRIGAATAFLTGANSLFGPKSGFDWKKIGGQAASAFGFA